MVGTINHLAIHPSFRPPSILGFVHPSIHQSIYPFTPNSCIHGPTIEIIFQLALHPIIHPSRNPEFLPTICWLILQYLSAPSIIHLGIQPSIIFFHFTIQGFVPPLSGDSIHQSIHPFFPKSLPSVAPQSISSFIRQSIQSSIHHTLFYQLIHPAIHPSFRPSVDSFNRPRHQITHPSFCTSTHVVIQPFISPSKHRSNHLHIRPRIHSHSAISLSILDPIHTSILVSFKKHFIWSDP